MRILLAITLLSRWRVHPLAITSCHLPLAMRMPCLVDGILYIALRSSGVSPRSSM